MPRDNLSRVWCGKRTYPDFPSAVRAARGINERTNGLANAYYCATCQSFHFGRKGTRSGTLTDKSLEDTTVLQSTIEKHKSAAAPKVDAMVKATTTPDRELSWLAQRVAKGRDAPFCEIAAITPAIAAHLLERNDDNRPVSEKQVSQICVDIAQGHWELNGESIIVAKDGSLNDGQNRLAAIHRSGKSIQTVIVFGVSRNSRLSVDMGRQRTSANFLAMQGVKSANGTAAVTGLIEAYFKGFYAPNSGTANITKQQLLAAYDLRHKVIDKAVQIVWRDKFAVSYAASPIAAAYVILSPLHPSSAEDFFTKLFSGESLKRGNPILYCRAHLMESGSKRLRGAEKLELILRYWMAWSEGKTLAQRIRLQGSHPKLASL